MSWVLKAQHRRRNLFRPQWWRFIEGAEHRWARALNSSQCFGVNLFAPLATDKELARRALKHLSGRSIDDRDEVVVLFEFTPAGAAGWLGEARQPTQVDVCFEVKRSGRARAFVLVEVKYTEPGFGVCRGWKLKANTPDRIDCLDASAVVNDAPSKCWLVKTEARKYWELMSRPNSSIVREAVRTSGACPFRYGLYQLMRNRVLADELVYQTAAEWADLAVCCHSANSRLRVLEEPVLSNQDAIEAFQSLSSINAIKAWDARRVLDVIAGEGSDLRAWRDWMEGRYFAEIVAKPFSE